MRNAAAASTELGGDDRQHRRRGACVRVLHTIETEDAGGAEQILLDLVRALGPEYDSVVGVLKKGWLWSQVRSSHTPWMMLEGGGDEDVRLVADLVRLVRRERIDLIHAHEFYMNAVCAVVSRLTGVPLVATVHGRNYYPERLRRRVIYRMVVAQAAAVVSVSEDLRCFFCRATWTSPGRVRVIYNGVDPDAWGGEGAPEVRRLLGIPTDAAVVGTVGSLYPVKGHAYLIRAARLILERRPNVHFVLVGGGPLEGDLRAQAEALGIRKQVHLVGHREDVRRLLGAMDIFALPSLSEGLPLALLQAMAAGKTPVVTEVGGVPEVVRDGETGFAVPPANPEALADGVIRLLESPSVAARIGACARQCIRERFSLQAMVAAYRDVYRTALVVPSTHQRSCGR